MNKMISKLSNVRGLTFLEIMIALAITGFVTAAVFQLYVTQHENYMTQDDITEIQQNARASIDQLAKTIRMAGYDTPDGVAAIEAYNTNPDTILLTFRDDDCETYLSIAMASVSSPLQCATAVACFSDGQWLFIFEPDSGGGEWFQVSTIDNGANTVYHASDPFSKAYTKDAIVISMEQVKFYIDTTSDSNYPALMVEPRGEAATIFADNIIDLQLQYKMKNGMTVDVPALPDNIRQVLIGLTGRSKNPNPDDQVNPYRFRTFNTSVSLRNLSS